MCDFNEMTHVCRGLVSTSNAGFRAALIDS